MEELYLIGYTHEVDAETHKREIKSISFREFTGLRRLDDIVHKIEKQTGDRSVQVIAVTALHKLIDYAGENKTNSITSSLRGH